MRQAARPWRAAAALTFAAGLWLFGALRCNASSTADNGPVAKKLGDGGSGTADLARPGALGRRLEEDSVIDGLDEGSTLSSAEALLNAFGLFYMFLALAVVCDEFFVPALDLMSERLGVTPDVAGATFMAAGGSAPEFFTAMAGVLQTPPSDVGISTIVGSAVFNVLFVIGMCGIAAPEALQLSWYPLARDCCFYVVHLMCIFVFFYDGIIRWWESLTLFCLYITYCVFMVFSERVENRLNDRIEYRRLDVDDKGFITEDEANGDVELSKAFKELDVNDDGRLSFNEVRVFFLNRRSKKRELLQRMDVDEPEKPSTLCPPQDGGVKDWAYYIVSFPIVLVLICTVPDCRREGCCWKNLYPLTFLLSILWVAAFSWMMVKCSEAVGEWTQIDQRVLALTLLAAGTSVPDLLTSLIVTLQGHGDMAIASSIGSNIFDITVGLPVPWLVYTSYYLGEPISVQSTPRTLASQIGMLLGMLVFVVLGIHCCKWVLHRALGYTMLLLYLGFMAFSIYQIEMEQA